MKRRPIPWVLAILVSATLLGQACKDPDSPKPDEKFYCKVNGKHWRPDSDGDFKAHTLLADFKNNFKHLAINARNAELGESIIIIMSETDSIIKGKHKLSVIESDISLPPSAYFMQNRKPNFTTSSTNTGTFRILSIERDPRILTSVKLKAEFEFTAASPSGEIVRITDGRFYNWVRISQ